MSKSISPEELECGDTGDRDSLLGSGLFDKSKCRLQRRWAITCPHIRFLLASTCLLVLILTVYALSASTNHLNPNPPRSQWLRSSSQYAQPRITILQHFNLHNDRIRALQKLSREQHERYASFWGYGYVRSTDQVVPEENTTVRQRQMNKVYVLMGLVLEELAKGEQGAEWILITDADVLVIDPSIPLHALLPAENAHPDVQAFIVGSEDGNGFNSGNMIYRCNLDLAAFLAHTIALSDDITRAYDIALAEVSLSNGKDPKIETPPSDQRAVCLVLEQEEAYSSRFFHYPQEWLNSYDLPPKSNAPLGGSESENPIRIQLHTHLVANNKYRTEYSKYIEVERSNWEKLIQMSSGELEERVWQVQEVAHDHWQTARVGLPKCIWI